MTTIEAIFTYIKTNGYQVTGALVVFGLIIRQLRSVLKQFAGLVTDTKKLVTKFLPKESGANAIQPESRFSKNSKWKRRVEDVAVTALMLGHVVLIASQPERLSNRDIVVVATDMTLLIFWFMMNLFYQMLSALESMQNSIVAMSIHALSLSERVALLEKSQPPARYDPGT